MMTIPYLRIISPAQRPLISWVVQPTDKALVEVTDRILKSSGFNNTDVILSPTSSIFTVLCIDPRREVIPDRGEFYDFLLNKIAIDRGVRIELVQNEVVVAKPADVAIVGVGSLE